MGAIPPNDPAVVFRSVPWDSFRRAAPPLWAAPRGPSCVARNPSPSKRGRTRFRARKPSRAVIGLHHSNGLDVSALGKQIRELSHEIVREVLVKDQLHPPITESRRSRSAANAKQARICSSVSSGKSAKISGILIPLAKYSSTSVTVMRRPRIHGLPLRFPASIVMMWR